LEFPAINPANAAECGKFRLGISTPDNHAPPAPTFLPQSTPLAKEIACQPKDKSMKMKKIFRNICCLAVVHAAG